VEGQQPRDLAGLSPRREHPVHGDHRPDRHPRRLGASAAAPIYIPFGTAPTPTPVPVAPPTLTPVALGTNGTGGSLLYAPDGSQLLSTVGLVPGSSTASPSASASPSPTPTPASSTPTPEGAISAAPEVPGGLVEYTSSGQRHRLDRRRVRSPTRLTAAGTWRWRSTTAMAVADRHQPEQRIAAREAHRLAHAGHRSDLGHERPNHLYRRHHHRLGRPLPSDGSAVHASAGSGRSRSSPRWRVCVRLAGDRHRRLTGQRQHRVGPGAPRRRKRRRIQRRWRQRGVGR